MNTDARRHNTPAEMIEVIEAHRRGEALESRPLVHSRCNWTEASIPRFNFGNRQYRVKPAAPVEGFAVVDARGRIRMAANERHLADAFASRVSARGVFRVIPIREVRD